MERPGIVQMVLQGPVGHHIRTWATFQLLRMIIRITE